MSKRKISIILSVLLILSSMPNVVMAGETGPKINTRAIEFVTPTDTPIYTGAAPEVANINLVIGVGETVQLLMTGNKADNLNMNWYLSGYDGYPDSHTGSGYRFDAVSVDKMGRVSGLNVGCLTIIAESKDGTYVAGIHIVVVPLEELEEMRLTIGIKEGEFVRLSVNCATATHTSSGQSHIEWKSLTPTVATVNKFGKVTGVNAGTGNSELAIIQAKDTYSGKVEIIYVRVYRN